MVCADGKNSSSSRLTKKCSLLTLKVGSITQPKAPRFVKKDEKNLIPTQDTG